MSGTNAWGRMYTPAKQSQFELDQFEEWKKKQDEEIGNSGADSSPAVEEEHNRHMLRQNLNAYVCYKELDKYTMCLSEKKLISFRDGNGEEVGGGRSSTRVAASFEINMKNKVNEKLCRATHTAYASCMSSEKNQEAVLQSASLEPQCSASRANLFQCMREHQEEEAQTNTPQCDKEYRGLLRCGLNHLWNRYWRAVTAFSDTDEFHLYELSRDDNKKQAYVRALTSTATQQQVDREEARAVALGYYLNPEDDPNTPREAEGQGRGS